MNHFRHLFLIYLRRFRVELALWGLVTLSASILALSDTPTATQAPLARIEIVAALWLLLRICLADEVFGTLAGKRTRPLAPGDAAVARAALLVAAFLPALVLRGFVWWRWSAPDSEEIIAWIGSETLPVMMWLALLAVLLQATAEFARWSGSRRLAPALLIGGCGVAIQWNTVRHTKADVFDPERFGDLLQSSADIASPLFQALPTGASILDQRSGISDDDPPIPGRKIEVIRKLPLRAGHLEKSAGGSEWRIRAAGWRGTALQVELTSRGLETQRGEDTALSRDAILLVRYGNGEFGTSAGGSFIRQSSTLSLARVEESTTRARFRSPLMTPWNQDSPADLLKHAEIWVLESTTVPAEPPPEGPVFWNRQNITREEFQTLPLPPFGAKREDSTGTYLITARIPTEEEAGLATQFDACMSLLRGGWAGEDQKRAPFLDDLLPKGARLMPHLLRWPAWSGRQWQQIVRPILMEHASAADLPALTVRLADEPRLTEIFIAKGWADHALPVLRERAKQRQSLSPAAVELLARLRDPDLAADLAAAALKLSDSLDRVGPLLRDYPDFDWPAFVAEGWTRWKYGASSRGWIFSAWAAELGDRTALQRLARLAAAGNSWEREQLERLIPAAGPDPVSYVRAHLESIVFDEAVGYWRVEE